MNTAEAATQEVWTRLQADMRRIFDGTAPLAETPVVDAEDLPQRIWVVGPAGAQPMSHAELQRWR